MYTLEFLDEALRDIVEIAQYITKALQNPQAAVRLTNKMIEKAEKVCNFPYLNRVFTPIKPLKREYRKIIVDNYIIFYFIDEDNKKVLIARVVYAKRNISSTYFDNTETISV